MEILYHSRLLPEFMLSPLKGKCWKLAAPFEFSVDGERFVVPQDFWTDFASVPRFIWPIISPYDLGVGPIPHDLGYFSGFRTREFWDRVLLACMERDGIAPWRRRAAYRAVDWFAGGVWANYRRTNTEHSLSVSPANKMEVNAWGLRAHVGKMSDALLGAKELAWRDRTTQLTAY